MKISILILFFFAFNNLLGQKFLKLNYFDHAFASRDRYVISEKLNNNNIYLYSTYEEVINDVSPVHLIINSRNEILEEKNERSYDILMPAQDVSVAVYRDFIYVFGKLKENKHTKFRLIKFGLNLEILFSSDITIPELSALTTLEVDSIGNSWIVYSSKGDTQGIGIIKLNSEGETIGEKFERLSFVPEFLSINFDKNSTGLNILTTEQNEILSFRIDANLNIYSNTIAPQINDCLYKNLKVVESDENLFLAFNIEKNIDGQLFYYARMAKFNLDMQKEWEVLLGNADWTSTFIDDFVINRDTLILVGHYLGTKNEYNTYFQSLSTTNGLANPIMDLFVSFSNDIPQKIISIPENKYVVAGFSESNGFFANAWLLHVNQAGHILNQQIEHGGVGGKEPEYFNIFYDNEGHGINILGNYYYYNTRPEMPFYSFDYNNSPCKN